MGCFSIFDMQQPNLDNDSVSEIVDVQTTRQKSALAWLVSTKLSSTSFFILQLLTLPRSLPTVQ